MAQTATIYNLKIHLTDMDRQVYETLDVRVARQPSETVEYMLTRVIAYCLEYQEGIALTEGVAAGSDPAVLVRDMTGRVTAWIEVGLPDPERLHRGMKLAGRAAVYTHRDVRKLLAQLASTHIHMSSSIPVYAISSSFIEEVASVIDRRSECSLSVTDRELFLSMAGSNFSTTLVEHRLA